MIDVVCPQCGTVYHADLMHVGKHINCTKCGSLLPILDRAGRLVQQPVGPADVPRTSSRVKPTVVRGGLGTAAYFLGFAAVVVFAAALFVWDYNLGTKGNKSESARQPAAATSPTTSPQIRNGPASSSSGSDASQVTAEELVCGNQTALPTEEIVKRPASYRSLPTGTRIMEDFGNYGRGLLDVQNGTSEDAVVQLYDVASDRIARSIYVQANRSVRITAIPESTYELDYSTGLDWDASQLTFCWRPSYSQFERELRYAEKHEQKRVQYDEIRVTLHPVIGGNVRTRAISRKEFLKGRRRTAF